MRQALLWTAAVVVLQGSVAAADDERSSLGSRVVALTDVILDNHFDPPTRQQLVLEGTKALYLAAGKPVPKGWSRQISAQTSKEQLSKFLDDLGSRFNGKPGRFETALVNGMLRSVPGQPRLVAGEEFKVQGQLAANRYVGTGIVLSMNGEAKRPAMPKVFYNGPAWKAGAKDGDIILEIDGESSERMTVQQVIALLRGNAGSVVEVKVRQPGAEDTRTLKITRGVAFIPTVEGHRELPEGKWRYRVDTAKDVAYIRIQRIGSSTVHELRQAEAQLRGERLRGVVLDLRYGGGILHDTVMLADELLEEGPIGGVRSADAVKTYKANPGALFKNVPMAVLVDRIIGADRELLAAALQDTGRAVIVGEPTAGRGFVRTGIAVPGRKETLILAIGVVERADGTPLLAPRHPSLAQRPKPESTKKHRPGGIVPDHVATMTNKRRGELMAAYSHTRPGLRKPVEDPQLAKAVEVLKSGKRHAGAGPSNPNASG